MKPILKKHLSHLLSLKSRRILSLIGISFFLLSFSCEKDFAPVKVQKPVKNPREYTWTVDTLEYPGSNLTWMTSIWGSSNKDVYAVGLNSTNKGTMYHYNGTNWTPVPLTTSLGGNLIGSFDLSDVYGFSKTDIWAAGNWNVQNPTPPPNFLHPSLLIHYNGSEWEEINTPEGLVLENIWGASPDNVWFVGINGTLYHWDGNTITKDSIPFNIPKDAAPVYNLDVTGNSGGQAYFLLTARPQSGDSYYEIYYLFKKELNTWQLLDSTYVYLDHVWMGPCGTQYVFGSGVYTYNNQSFDLLFYENFHVLDLYGISEKNLFAVGSSSKAYHYNGTDWFQLKYLEISDLLFYTGVWTDGRELFISGPTRSYPRKTIMFHGK